MEDIKDAELKLQCLSLLLVATGQENVSELVSDEQHCHGESCRGNKCNAFMYLYFGYLIWKIMLANHVCVVFIHLYYPAIDIYGDMWEQKWQLCCELNLKTPLSWRLAWPGVFGSKHNILCCPSGNLRLELLK